jgi:hypothetical protein
MELQDVPSDRSSGCAVFHCCDAAGSGACGCTRNAALLVVAEWMRDGVPDPKRQGTRPVANVLDLDVMRAPGLIDPVCTMIEPPRRYIDDG